MVNMGMKLLLIDFNFIGIIIIFNRYIIILLLLDLKSLNQPSTARNCTTVKHSTVQSVLLLKDLPCILTF